MPKQQLDDLALLFSLLVRAEIRLYNLVDDRLRADCSLPVGHFAILRCVAGTENCRVGDIAAQMAVTVGATSRSVDRLEDQGLLRRTPNPQNRRSSLIVLTPAGEAAIAAAAPSIDAEMARWLDPALTAEQRRELTAMLQRVVGGLEDAGVGRPTG